MKRPIPPSQGWKPDPRLDLVLERVVDVPRELVWAAWTRPEHVRKWFTPAPWTVSDCEIDLRPGGIFRTVMRSPKARSFPTSAAFWRSFPTSDWCGPTRCCRDTAPRRIRFFTAIIALEPHGSGTRYIATAIHRDEAGRKKHETWASTRAGARRSISSSRTSRRCERRDGTYLISCGSPPRDCCVSSPAPKTWSDD